MPLVFRGLTAALLSGQNDAACYLAVRDLVLGMGPGCKQEIPIFLAAAHQRPTSVTMVFLLAKVSPLVPMVKMAVLAHMLRVMHAFVNRE